VRIRRSLRAFGPDVVHVHEPFSPLTSLEALVAARAPLVGTFHAYAQRSIALAALSPALRPLWTRMRVRLAVSEAAAEYAGRHFRGAVRVVPNGADVELFRDASPSSGLPEGRKVVFVNRLEPRKGFGVAVRAFGLLADELPDVHLIVAGDGPERDAVGVLPAGTRERVVMLGTVPHLDLPPFLAAADVSVAPALGRESFGIVLVEAMAAGLPVIASDIPGYREVVRDGLDGILVPPNDPAGLAGGLRRVLDDPDLRARLAAAGRERAEAFRWDVVAAQIEAAYREAASL
jgi:phosphatidylinositol alpha-mannosyltransferase